MESKHIKPEAIRLFVLDEADKLMEPAFKPDLTWIFNQLPLHKQVIALSATYPKDLSNVVTKFMSSPQHVRLNPSQSNVLIGVSQFWMSCEFHPLQHIEADRKFKVLLEILNKVSFSQCLIFSNYSTRAEAICEKLDANGWPVEFLAGTMEQKNRLRALNNLKQFSCRVLITTDLSARGIDSQHVNLVINLEVPWVCNNKIYIVVVLSFSFWFVIFKFSEKDIHFTLFFIHYRNQVPTYTGLEDLEGLVVMELQSL